MFLWKTVDCCIESKGFVFVWTLKVFLSVKITPENLIFGFWDYYKFRPYCFVWRTDELDNVESVKHRLFVRGDSVLDHFLHHLRGKDVSLHRVHNFSQSSSMDVCYHLASGDRCQVRPLLPTDITRVVIQLGLIHLKTNHFSLWDWWQQSNQWNRYILNCWTDLTKLTSSHLKSF